jgi:alkaline phosphatase D
MRQSLLFAFAVLLLAACTTQKPAVVATPTIPPVHYDEFPMPAAFNLPPDSLLQSGPMLGYSEMKEALVWVQTKYSCYVEMKYWKKGEPTRKYVARAAYDGNSTVETDAHIYKFIADSIEPSNTYEYQLFMENQPLKLPYPTEFKSQTLWQYRTDPPEFTCLLGSCTYINEPRYDRPGKGYGSNYSIFKSMNDKKPTMMLWLGDNTYLRETDYNTRTGIIHRFTHSRSLPEMQPLLASTNHYAIWDDHDFGPNDSDRSWVHKDWTMDAFKAFWGNPSYGVNGKPGVTTTFSYNDVDFLMLDNRYYRSPNERKTGERTVLGKDQLEWFFDALASSTAPFKIVALGGQFLSSAALYENYANYATERQQIIDFIDAEKIKGVIFVTGDRHHTELSKLVTKGGVTIYDLTCSPFTSGTGSSREEVNTNRVDGTLLIKHNFGILTFQGKRKDRVCKIQIFDKDGAEQWTRAIGEKDFLTEKKK